MQFEDSELIDCYDEFIKKENIYSFNHIFVSKEDDHKGFLYFKQ